MDFYTPRNIGPADQILFDSDGNAVGIQPAASSSPPVLGFNPTKHAAIDSLVSGEGNLASADIATTTGTPGEVRRISDGDNRGAILMWSTPEGSTTPQWCWWLWPQASYF